MPKGVINTQRMLCSNQAMIAAHLPFLADEPPVLVDWLPWNHTFGGNHNVGIAIHNGGSLYIDDGKPMPGAIERTVRNLREIAPTIYFNVPRGFEALLPFWRKDRALRENFFSRLKVDVLCGREPLANRLGRDRGARLRDLRGTHRHAHRARRDRDRAVGNIHDARRRVAPAPSACRFLASR